MIEYPQRITLCGFGGQGIVLSSVILGTTAVTKGHLFAVQTASYGSEARGGECQAELIIDEKPINSPTTQKKNLLVALFQTAYQKYIPTLEENGVLIIDPDLVNHITRPIEKTIEVPATQIAVDTGNRVVANMVMLGFMSESLGLIKKEELVEVVTNTVNERFHDLNIRAIEAGADYAKKNKLYC